MNIEKLALFNLTEAEKKALIEFHKDVGETKADSLIGVVSGTTELTTKAQQLLQTHPGLISKIIQSVNANPEVVEKEAPDIYELLKKSYPPTKAPYYVPPIAGVDPMDARAAVPAMVAVVVVATALMFVGRSGFRGVA